MENRRRNSTGRAEGKRPQIGVSAAPNPHPSGPAAPDLPSRIVYLFLYYSSCDPQTAASARVAPLRKNIPRPQHAKLLVIVQDSTFGTRETMQLTTT